MTSSTNSLAFLLICLIIPACVVNEADFEDVRNALRTQLKGPLMVVTALSPPFTMYRANHSDRGLRGNDRFEGYCVDLLKELSTLMGFKYELKLADDGSYGSDTRGIWNGMIGEVITGKVHMAIADLTITRSREQVIDFTLPFMGFGISVLYKKSPHSGVSTQAFSDLTALGSPLVRPVIAILFTFCTAIGIILLLVERRRSSTAKDTCVRLIFVVWGVILLIFLSLYMAHVTVSVYHENLVLPTKVMQEFESVEDLAVQEVVQYGTVHGGSTQEFFRQSNVHSYQRMWDYMERTKPTVFVKSTSDGIERVKRGGFAFLAESPLIEYATQRDCQLYQVGGLLNKRHFGLAVAKESKYRTIFNQGLLQLQENGVLLQLKKRWWSERMGAKRCDNTLRAL